MADRNMHAQKHNLEGVVETDGAMIRSRKSKKTWVLSQSGKSGDTKNGTQ